MHNELTKIRKDTLNLQLSLQRYRGDDLSSVKLGDLDELELQIEHSINKVRSRKASVFSHYKMFVCKTIYSISCILKYLRIFQNY